MLLVFITNPFFFLFLFLFLFLPHFSTAAIKPIFIFSLGGGSSMIAEGGLRSNEFVFDTLIDFKEKLELKNLWSFNLQAYFLRDIGIQMEYMHQKANYYSDLKWYGWWYTGDIEPVYIPINHFEDPYWTPWSIKSTSVGLIFGGDSPLFGELFPYATAAIGLYKVKGDPELFSNRTRLGSLTQGMTVRVSAGVRHRILPFLGINFRISGETMYRSHGRIGLERNYQGPDQLDIERFYQTGQIYRSGEMLVKAFTYLSIEINLEFILKIPNRTN